MQVSPRVSCLSTLGHTPAFLSPFILSLWHACCAPVAIWQSCCFLCGCLGCGVVGTCDVRGCTAGLQASPDESQSTPHSRHFLPHICAYIDPSFSASLIAQRRTARSTTSTHTSRCRSTAQSGVRVVSFFSSVCSPPRARRVDKIGRIQGAS